MPLNTEQKLPDILILFVGGNSSLLEKAKGIGKLSLESWEMSLPKTRKGLGRKVDYKEAGEGWKPRRRQ